MVVNSTSRSCFQCGKKNMLTSTFFQKIKNVPKSHRPRPAMVFLGRHPQGPCTLIRRAAAASIEVLEPATDTGAVAQPLDEARAHKKIAKMMGTELGIAAAHPFQLGAVLALAYNTVALRSLGRQGTAKAPSSTPQCGYFEAVATSLIGANQSSGRLVYRTSIAHTIPSCRGLEGSRV